jgi:hypothetical protein
MESAVTTPAGTIALGALGRALQLTKNIMDLVGGVRPSYLFSTSHRSNRCTFANT